MQILTVQTGKHTQTFSQFAKFLGRTARSEMGTSAIALHPQGRCVRYRSRAGPPDPGQRCGKAGVELGPSKAGSWMLCSPVQVLPKYTAAY